VTVAGKTTAPAEPRAYAGATGALTFTISENGDSVTATGSGSLTLAQNMLLSRNIGR